MLRSFQALESSAVNKPTAVLMDPRSLLREQKCQALISIRKIKQGDALGGRQRQDLRK